MDESANTRCRARPAVERVESVSGEQSSFFMLLLFGVVRHLANDLFQHLLHDQLELFNVDPLLLYVRVGDDAVDRSCHN